MSVVNQIHVQSRAVIISHNHILLCRTTCLATNFYFLPGGHIDHGESAAAACIREMKEEIGLDFKIKNFLGCIEYAFDPAVTMHAKCHTQEYTFVFEAFSPEAENNFPEITGKEAHLELTWHPYVDLDRIDIRPALLKKQIPIWLQENHNEALISSMNPIQPT